MMRIDDSAELRDWARDLADRLRTPAAPPIALRCTEAEGRSRVLSRVLGHVEAVHVQVPESPDQAERVLLEIAQALGGDVARDIDAQLRAEPEVPESALKGLRKALDGRKLIVDGWDRLVASAIRSDIGITLEPRISAVRRWLGELGVFFVIGSGRAPECASLERLPKLENPPVVLANGAVVPERHGLWDRFYPLAEHYELALALLALGASPEDAAIESATDYSLRSRIVELLPDSLACLLRLLSLHERPLREDLARLLSEGIGAEADRVVRLGAELGLWRRSSTGLFVDGGWCRWWREELDAHQRRESHRTLANLFAAQVTPGDPGAGRAGLSILEAHRHYLCAGDVQQAQAYGRYGAALLVEEARRRSVKRAYAEAAEIYAWIVREAESGALPVGRRLRSYARHYLHYNRAHARSEDLRSTVDGYKHSLEDWPENALFWSRLVRALFYDNRPAEALAELHEARRKVPEHPEKDNLLIARTVRRLIERDGGRMLDAIRVWDGWQPDAEQGREVMERFASKLAEGWKASPPDLTLDPQAPLVFLRPQEVRIERVGSRWFAHVGPFERAGRGASPVEALRAAIGQLRADAQRLLRAYTSDLDSTSRQYKQRLLGVLDVVASRVDARPPSKVWVFGDLVRDEDGTLWIHTGGPYNERFEIPSSLAKGVVVDGLPHFALVDAKDGRPRGPVLKLEAGVRRSADEIWREWRRRLADGQ